MACLAVSEYPGKFLRLPGFFEWSRMPSLVPTSIVRFLIIREIWVIGGSASAKWHFGNGFIRYDLDASAPASHQVA
jgi:hypothetical protein